MRAPHLRAILWLRSRIARRRFGRHHIASAVLATMLLVGAAAAGVLLFLTALVVGLATFDEASPGVLLVIFDVVVGLFLIFWLIGVLTELQRSDALSLEKLLHLPIGLRSAFLLNYASSLLSLSMAIFLPALFGLSIALIAVRGPQMLVVLLLIASFFFMVTALTYQFRGWLAVLMENKRRRGTVIAIMTVAIIALVQAPQIFNLMAMNSRSGWRAHADAIAVVQAQIADGTLTGEEATARLQALEEQRKATEATERAATLETALVINRVVPVGWLPYGTYAVAERSALGPALLGTFGALLIGGLSLARAYQTTLRFHTGAFQSKRRRAPKPVPVAAGVAPDDGPKYMERRIYGLPEGAAAVARGTFRVLLREPQAKMVLVAPILLLTIFGVLLFRQDTNLSDRLPPFIALGGLVLVMVMLSQLTLNVFGLDRAGFRAFVLAPIPRREILLGKNVGLAPIAVALGLLTLIVLQCVRPMTMTHLLASVIQFACIFLICSLGGNLISILAPMAIAEGSLKPARPKITMILKQMVFFLLVQLALIPTVLPLGIEVGLEAWRGEQRLPIYLLLSLIELPLVVWGYRAGINAQGRLLAAREQRVLAEVASGVE